MSEWIQMAIIAPFVVWAFVLVGRKLRNALGGDASACGSSCSGCPLEKESGCSAKDEPARS